VRAALGSHGIVALRADDKQYHHELFPNIRTYMHGCDFGVAVFERLEQDDFNPNVSLEVGYMIALGKPVCLMKDRTLRQLHTDIVGHLYRVFDPQHPRETIPEQLAAWLRDWGYT
jgi:nucleoside 2-deoxyribosyltransferase